MVLVENVKCGQTNVFNNILETKNALKTVKTTSSKSGEIDIFQRGRHEPMLFVQKWPFFQLFFRQYRPGKSLLRYSRTKKRLSRQ